MVPGRDPDGQSQTGPGVPLLGQCLQRVPVPASRGGASAGQRKLPKWAKDASAWLPRMSSHFQWHWRWLQWLSQPKKHEGQCRREI